MTHGPERHGNPERLTNEILLRTLPPEQAFAELGAPEWIDEFRVETGGKLDIGATAEKVGIEVRYEMPVIAGKRVIAQGMIRGLREGETADESTIIHLNPETASDEHDLTFGHELGHLFLKTAGIVPDDRDVRVEAFCEFFGRQMVVPIDQLPAAEEVTTEMVTELMARFGVWHTTIIYQLMLAGQLPRRIFIDTSIGQVPNEFFSGKVYRHCLCLECETGEPHDPTSENYLPVYDFTAFEWHDTTPGSLCVANSSSDMNTFILVNQAYGRWNQADAAKVSQEVLLGKEIRETLAKAAIEASRPDDGVPF